MGQHIRVGVVEGRGGGSPQTEDEPLRRLSRRFFLATSTVSAEVPWGIGVGRGGGGGAQLQQRRPTDVSLPGPLCQSVAADKQC